MPATKPSEMVERVARAICVHQNKDARHGPDERTFLPNDRMGGFWETFSEVARVAIAAMREPTEAMHEAGDAVISDGEGFPHDKPLPTLRNAYRAMIDAALKEDK